MPSRRELANAIRALSMDAVQKAQSGHPGAPMGMADIAEVLWNDFLDHNPHNPDWPDRDRFVLSNGHGSMLLYSLLHLTGYEVSLEALQQFRQLDSGTAGHPEYGELPGVETTTGPLGQGLANAVGMALAEKALAARFNVDGMPLVDHYTYVFMGDGCLMEGISHEACSLAGHLGLGKLIGFYDDNGISIDGQVEGWFTEATAERFRAYGWHVIDEVDGHDADAVRAAIEAARAKPEQPSLLVCKTLIGFGAPNKAGTADVHGAALGEEEVQAARERLGWTHPPFHVPEAVYEGWDARAQGARSETAWRELVGEYEAQYPELAAEFKRRMAGELPEAWTATVNQLIEDMRAGAEKTATRKASQKCLNRIGPQVPELLGGSADLSGSNNTLWSGARLLSSDEFDGDYIYYGVREFGMSAIMNGLRLHGGFIPYGGTFLVFMDYARNAVRMAALMRLPTIFVYTHDSIGLGEDGPTHQPVEQLVTLRSTPNMATWRPCDTVETAVAWQQAVERRDGPSALVLTRQSVPHIERDDAQVEAIKRGGYVLKDAAGGRPELILMASGSELALALEAGEALEAQGRAVRVVSMPSLDAFEAQPADYRDSVLPREVRARVAVEAAAPASWHRYVGLDGAVIGLERFGESGPYEAVYEHLGVTAERVQSAAEALLPGRG